MDRRSFLKGAAALFAAPAIVKAEILMPVKQPIWTPDQMTMAHWGSLDPIVDITDQVEEATIRKYHGGLKLFRSGVVGRYEVINYYE